MQSSESLGLPPNSLSTEESIKQRVKYFNELLASSERLIRYRGTTSKLQDFLEKELYMDFLSDIEKEI